MRDQHLRHLIAAGLALSAEHDRSVLIERILVEAKSIAHADGGTLYLHDQATETLRFVILHNDSLNVALGGTSGQEITLPSLRMTNPETGLPNHSNVCTAAALSGRTINITDAYTVDGYDFSGTRTFDARIGYKSQSFLTVPLKAHNGQVIGVLQLINAQDQTGQVVPFSQDIQDLVEALASQAAVALENQNLIEAQRGLVDALVKILAGAIDAKSPYTSGHSQRVPAIAELMAKAACEARTGPFATFNLSDSEWYELHVAAYLHDCGKVITPEYIMDKATKLEIIHNRIHEVRNRFEILRRDAEVTYWRARAEGADEAQARATFDATVRTLEDDFAFIAASNLGGEFMSPTDMERVHRIGQQTWIRHFDRTLGLSWQELERSSESPSPPAPAVEPLLSDRLDHCVDCYNFGELYNLCISRGTISPEERQKINDHIVVTQNLLDQMPFPHDLRHVPEIAGNHHEKIDGTGYPRGLKGEDMSALARMMAIADVFEALTASDRPYKKPKTLNESVKILAAMVSDGHFDPDLFALFLTAGVHTAYAQAHLQPEQVDAVDVAAYLEQIGVPLRG